MRSRKNRTKAPPSVQPVSNSSGHQPRAKKPKRRTKKPRRGQQNTMNIHTGDDIQEQLRLQREQQKRQKEQKQRELKQGEENGDIAPGDEQTGPLSVEGFVFHKERNAYFPVGCSENDTELPAENTDPDKNPYSLPRRRLHSAPFIPIHQCLDNGSFPSETNTSRWRWLTPFMAPTYMNPSRLRTTLVASWGARTLFSRWEVLERHTQMPPGLSHVADWCRSMDVCKNEDIVALSHDMPAQLFSGLDFSYSINGGDPLSDFYNVRVLPNQYIALFESLQSSKFSIVTLYKRDTFSQGSNLDFAVPESVNDVVRLKCQVVLAACSKQRSRGSCLYCAYPSGSFVDGTQQSDALCLEELGSQEALVGHRNGQVSIYDVRQSKTAAGFQSIEQSGNVVRMQLLPNSTSVLLQSSHPDHGGRISMLDVRGTTHDNLVWSAASSNGRGKRGMAILSNTLVVVPGSGMDRRGKTGCNVLDAWSLADGNLVGSFPLERKLDAEPHLMMEVAAANRKIFVRTWGEHSSEWTVLAERQLCSLKGSECLGDEGEGNIES